MEVITHKCPNCGGPLTFHPDDQKFHCDYCLSIFTEQEVEDFEAQQEQKEKQQQKTSEQTHVHSTAAADDHQEAQADTQAQAAEDGQTQDADEHAMELFICPSCGAEIVTDETTAATYCYYCHNPVVLSGRLSGKFRPEKVLPFAIEKKEAVNKFLDWTKKKWFIPKNFFNKSQIDKLTGVYFPYWAVDAKVNGTFSAKGTRVRIWQVGETEYTETKVYAIHRAGKINFKHLVKNALSKNTPQKMVKMVQPFDLDKSVDFKSQYLAGFQAEKRDIEIADLRAEINTDFKDYTKQIFRDTVNGYSTVTESRGSIDIQDMAEHYLLMPVWLVTYRSNDDSKKVYFYAMNGQTGEVSGILPISNQRLGLASLGIFALVLLIGLIVGYLI